MVAIALKREYSNLYPSGWTVTREDKQGRKDNLNSDTPFKPVRPSSSAKAQGSETLTILKLRKSPLQRLTQCKDARRALR